MKLIIDIPENLYKWIKDEYDNPNEEVAYSAIENGTPYEERPQGEWIFGSTLGHGWMKCSNCCVSQSGQTLCWSFCPNCGADMRKGGES